MCHFFSTKTLKFFGILLFTSIGSSIFAQFSFGAFAGFNTSKLVNELQNSTVLKNEFQNNFCGGGFVRADIGTVVYIQPEVVWSKRGGYLETKDNSNEDVILQDINYDAIDIPVMLGFYLYKPEKMSIRICGGPVFSFIQDDFYKITQGGIDIQDVKFSDRIAFVQVGIGFDFAFITIDARYEWSMTDIYKIESLGSQNKTLRVTAGFKIF